MNSSSNIIPNRMINTSSIRSGTAPPPAEQPEMLTVNQLSRLLGVTWLTLLRWRNTGKGPRFIRIATRAIRYRRTDVETWLADHTSW